jgi:hypothetical protein
MRFSRIDGAQTLGAPRSPSRQTRSALSTDSLLPLSSPALRAANAYTPSGATKAILDKVLLPTCGAPALQPAPRSSGCVAATSEPPDIDWRYLHELGNFLHEHGVAASVNVQPAQTLAALHRLLQIGSGTPKPSRHDGLLPQSDIVDNLIRHLSTARYFHPRSAGDTLSIDPLFQSHLVGECLMALLARGRPANEMQFIHFDFSKAIRVGQPIVAIKNAFAMALALKFGALRKEVWDWAAGMILLLLQPSLARNDTPPDRLFGDAEWVPYATGIAMIGKLGLDHGDYSYRELLALGRSAAAGAKFNGAVGTELWRTQMPIALWYGHAQRQFDLGTHRIDDRLALETLIRAVDRAGGAPLKALHAVIEALNTPARSREEIARQILIGLNVPPDHQYGMTFWNAPFVAIPTKCTGSRPLLEFYLMDCIRVISHYLGSPRHLDIPDLEVAVETEWNAFDHRHAAGFAAVLGNSLQRLPEEYGDDWRSKGFAIRRPLIDQWITAQGGDPIKHTRFAHTGLIVETAGSGRHRYFRISTYADADSASEPIIRLNATNEEELRRHVIENPRHFLHADELACASPCIESRATWATLAIVKKSVVGLSLESRTLGLAQALLQHRPDRQPETSGPLAIAIGARPHSAPYLDCFDSNEFPRLRTELDTCGIDLDEANLNVLRQRGDSRFYREQVHDAVLLADVSNDALATPVGQFLERIFHDGASGRGPALPARTLRSTLAAQQNTTYEASRLSRGYRLEPDGAPPSPEFFSAFEKMLAHNPSTARIWRNLGPSWRYGVHYSSQAGWQTAARISFAPGSPYRVKKIGSANNVLVKKLSAGIYMRVNPYSKGVFGPYLRFKSSNATSEATPLPARFRAAAITDTPGRIGLRFVIAPAVQVEWMQNAYLQTEGVFSFSLDNRVFQVDAYDGDYSLRSRDAMLRDIEDLPVCRDERGAQKKQADTRTRCLTPQSVDPASGAIRFEQIHPGNNRGRDNFVQQEPVEGRQCQLPRREQTIIFPENEGAYRDRNLAIIDGILFDAAHRSVRGESASAPVLQYRRLLEPARIGQGLPPVAALPAIIQANLIDLGPDRRPMIEYTLESEVRQSESGPPARIQTRHWRDFLSRRAVPGAPAAALIEVEEGVYFLAQLPSARQETPIRLTLERTTDRALIETFLRSRTVRERMLTADFSVEIMVRDAATIIEIFRLCDMRDFLRGALEQERETRVQTGGDISEITDALLNNLDLENDNPAEPLPEPVVRELTIALTEILKSPEKTARFRQLLLTRYQSQNPRVTFDEVLIPPNLGTPSALSSSPAAAQQQVEAARTALEMFSRVYPDLHFEHAYDAQAVNAQFNAVFDARNVAVLEVETVAGEIFYYDSVSGTREIPRRAEHFADGAQDNAQSVLVRDIPGRNATYALPHLSNVLWNLEPQSRAGDTERVLLSRVLADFPDPDALARLELLSLLKICQSCAVCCVAFAMHYRNATMVFSSIQRPSSDGPASVAPFLPDELK